MYIEERLPFFDFVSILNKQNSVAQNIVTTPDILPLISLDLISLLPLSKSDLVDSQNIDDLSNELWNSVFSFSIKHKHFKDYLNTALPIISFTKVQYLSHFKFAFNLEICFQPGIIKNAEEVKLNSETTHTLKNRFDVHSSIIETSNLELFYSMLKSEWVSMCKMFQLIKEIKAAFNKYPELMKFIEIKQLNLKKITLKYGHGFVHSVNLIWSKENKSYDIFLGTDRISFGKTQVDQGLINYHILFINEIKKHFLTNQSIINLVQLLNSTCQSTFGLAKLVNLPKYYAKISSHSIFSYPGFTLISRSLTHFKLIYCSKFCIDFQIKSNSIVSIRDGFFTLTDINASLEELQSIPLFSSFLSMFIDDANIELIKKNINFIDDLENEESVSPSQPNNLNYQGIIHQKHVFLPPTSPAVQARINNSIPTPSPIHNYVNSPGVPGPTSNTPSIAQSPGFNNFGSPAISANSPTGSQHVLNNQIHSTSPSGFMSPATNAQIQNNYSIQSPANFCGISFFVFLI